MEMKEPPHDGRWSLPMVGEWREWPRGLPASPFLLLSSFLLCLSFLLLSSSFACMCSLLACCCDWACPPSFAFLFCSMSCSAFYSFLFCLAAAVVPLSFFCSFLSSAPRLFLCSSKTALPFPCVTGLQKGIWVMNACRLAVGYVFMALGERTLVLAWFECYAVWLMCCWR